MKKINTQTHDDLLSNAIKKINLATNNVEINNIVEDLVTTVINTEFCSLWYYDKKNQTLLRERSEESLKTISLDEKKGIIYECFMTKKSKLYNYLTSEKGYVASIDNPDNIKMKSKIILPLIDQDELIGIVTGYSSIYKAKNFTSSDMKILESLSPYLIRFLNKMHLGKELSTSLVMNNNIKPLEISTNKETIKTQNSCKILHEMAGFIHDIRTPSNTLHGFLTLLEEQIADIRLKEYVSQAKSSATFINQLTNSMLEKISLENDLNNSKKLNKSHTKELSSTNFFVSIAEMFISNMYDKEICFNIFIDPLLPKTIEVDEIKLKRVLINLIGNAYKFTPSKETIIFRVQYDQKNNAVSIVVKDTGIGIAKENQAKIFEPFKQADDTTSVQYGGTGLGLSICSEYVKELGGELQLESELDKGSRFFFSLPLKVKDPQVYFKPLRNSYAKITIVTSAQNAFSLSNIVNYFVRMGIDKNNIVAVSSTKAIPKDTTHLVVYQHKMDETTETIMQNYSKVLIVEENLFSFNGKSIANNATVILQYGYYAKELYKFVTVARIPRVLIADDDKVSVSLLKTILKDEYCEIEVAQDGKEALDMMVNAYNTKNPYNVLYIDNNMPFMNGSEVIRYVREFEKENKLTPIYAVSISGDVMDAHTDKDINMHIGKPFMVNDVRQILRKAI